MYVYKIINLINNKIYIGISRKNSINSINYFGSGKAIKLAIKKYGKENFKKEIIEEDTNFKYSDLQRLEKYYIKKLNSKEKKIGYNISDGGDGNFGEVNGMYGKKHSKESKLSISKTRKKKIKLDPNYSKMSSEALDNFKKLLIERNIKNPTLPNGHSEETKLKISKTVSEKIKNGEIIQRHNKFSEERKLEYSRMFSGNKNPMYGVKLSKESLLKRNETLRNKQPSVKSINIETGIEKIYESLKDVEEDGFRIDCIRLVIKGDRKHHKNHKWYLI